MQKSLRTGEGRDVASYVSTQEVSLVYDLRCRRIRVRGNLQDLGSCRHEINEALVFAHAGKLAVLIHIINSVVPILDGFPQIEQTTIGVSQTGVHFGDYVLILGAVFGGGQLQRYPTARLALKNIRIYGQRSGILDRGLLVLLLRKVCRAQVAVERGGVVAQLDRLLVALSGAAVVLVDVLHHTKIVIRFWIGFIHLGRALKFTLGGVVAQHFQVGYADFIVQHGGIRLGHGGVVVIERVGEGLFTAKIVSSIFQFLGGSVRRRRLGFADLLRHQGGAAGPIVGLDWFLYRLLRLRPSLRLGLRLQLSFRLSLRLSLGLGCRRGGRQGLD